MEFEYKGRKVVVFANNPDIKAEGKNWTISMKVDGVVQLVPPDQKFMTEKEALDEGKKIAEKKIDDGELLWPPPTAATA